MPDQTSDPGGIFATDLQRRTLAHLPLPTDEPVDLLTLALRLDPDAHTPIFAAEGDAAVESLRAMLGELVSAGDADQIVDTDTYRMTTVGFDRLTGPIANEPGPLKGPRLKAAEALDDEIAAEDAAGTERAAKDRVKRAQEELAAAEEELKSGGPK